MNSAEAYKFLEQLELAEKVDGANRCWGEEQERTSFVVDGEEGGVFS